MSVLIDTTAVLCKNPCDTGMEQQTTANQSTIAALATNRTARVIAMILLAVLMAASAFMFIAAQIETSRLQNAITEVNLSVSDLSGLGRISKIANESYLRNAEISIETRKMLDVLNEGKCCTLDSAFVIPALNWLDSAANRVSEEKVTVRDMPLIEESSLALQTDVVTAYQTQEDLVKRFTRMIIDWDTVFGDERELALAAADNSIKSVGNSNEALLQRLEQAIVASREKQDAQAQSIQDMRGSIASQQTFTVIAIVVVTLSVLLLAGLLVLYGRERKATRQAYIAESHVRQRKRRKRT